LGGSGEDWATALAVHPTTGDIYVAGMTKSRDFPRTTGGAQASFGGRYSDAFVARLNKDLTQILQSTYLGGSGADWATALAIHPKTGEVYVAGGTDSTDFPNTTGGAQKDYEGKNDAFVARLDSNLTQILQSTYLGGSDDDKATALAIHPKTGEVYVAGGTDSTDFPNTTGGAQATCNKCFSKDSFFSSDAFVARLNSNLTQILQSTYLGGSDDDKATALAIHPKTGEVYVAGGTDSTDFPNTTGGAQATCNKCFRRDRVFSSDAFVARLNSNLTQIIQSTYLGGSGTDRATALAIHLKTGEVYVGGSTLSNDFPHTTGGVQRDYGGYGDAFVARLSADLAAGRRSADGGGYRMTGSVSSLTDAWDILLLLSVPAFVLARRIRRR
jgi:muconolactone delta-isomerase